MKKVIIIFTVIILSIFTVFSFSACNAIEGNDLSGTYRLESWTETQPDSETISGRIKRITTRSFRRKRFGTPTGQMECLSQKPRFENPSRMPGRVDFYFVGEVERRVTS